MPKISVIMSGYKEEIHYLKESINSILNQTYKDFELIFLLDNPSNQDIIDLLNDYCKKDNRIRFYINEENLGLAKTLNKALTLVNGEYIARMDADDVSMPDRLEKQLEYLVNNGYDLIGGLSNMIDEEGNLIYSIKSVPQDFDNIKKALCYNQVISHPTWFGKTEVFKKLEGYRLIPLCEDTDFTLRAVLKGFKISNYNNTVLNYRVTKNSISRSNLYEQFLYLQFITNKYKKGEIASLAEAKLFVEKHLNKKSSDRYNKANEVFNKALDCLNSKKYIALMGCLVKLPFISQQYLKKIYRLVRVSRYS